MLTTREGGATACAPERAEDDGEASDVGVNDLGDGGAAMHALTQPAVGGGSRRLEEGRTEETRQTVKAARVLNKLN